MRRIITTIIITFAPILTLADYHYVSHSGSDEYPYTSWETSADSMQPAIDATSPHDTVFVGSGHWYEAVQAGVYDSVAIVGMGWDSTFCHYDGNPEHYGIFVIDYGCSVSKIAFFGEGVEAGIFGMAYAGITITDCRFFRCTGGVVNDGYPLSLIENCIFDSCRYGISQAFITGDIIIHNNLMISAGVSDYAMQIANYNALVENNMVISSQYFPGDQDAITGSTVISCICRNNLVRHRAGGITVWGDAPEHKYNNTVLDIGNGPLYQQGLYATVNDTVANNLATNCSVGIAVRNRPDTAVVFDSAVIQYNCLWANDRDYYGEIWDSVGNIYADPMMVNPDSNDFRLQAYSPLINAGDPNILDVDGSRSDIGVYGGPGGRFYEYLDLPPQPPDSISYLVWNDTIFMDWRDNHETDFFGYSLHRDVISDFPPSPINLIAEPESSFYADADVVLGQTYYYRIASVDNQGNRSEYSPEVSVAVTGIWQGDGAEMPRMMAIDSNYPNPFNSATTIVYSVANLGPIPARISINIYDIQGRKVRTLIDERKEVGIYRIVWDGKGDNDEEMPSGIYFARISQWGQDFWGQCRKIILVR